MGKRLKTQRRGKGTPTYKAPSHRFKAESNYRPMDETEKEEIEGEVEELIQDPSKTTILMQVQYENGDIRRIPAPEGIMKGDRIREGKETKSKTGNITMLENIPEGYPVFNIELKPGDGGKIARASGAMSWIISKEGNQVEVKLPSKKTKRFNGKCRATIGKAAGGGRTEKPMLKAGKNYHKKKARGHKYPTVRGVKMSAVDHPFGGKQHHYAITKKGKTGSPGQHVGSFGSKSTGRKKRDE